MIQRKHIKKITTFLLLLVTILTLVACSKKESVPYGNISENPYLSLGNDITVTEKEVYETLRKQSGTSLPKLIEEKLFESYKTKAIDLLNTANAEKGSDAEYAQKAFDDLVNTALFGTTSEDSLKKLTDLNIEISISKFVDSVYVQDSTIDRAALKLALTTMLDDQDSDDFAKSYYANEVLRKLYLVDIQKRLYAKEVLAKEVLDKDSSVYVADKDVISYYTNNVKKRFDSNVFLFYFLNLNEANAALRNLNLKTNSRGHWFNLPDIRLVSTISDYPEASNPYLWEIIDKVDLRDKVTDVNPTDATRTKVTETDYKRFYDTYAVSESRDEKLEGTVLLNKFIDLYNEVNDVKLAHVALDADLNGLEIKFADTNEVYETEKSYDDLTKINASLRNYIYDTLTVEKPYSTLRSVGTFRYLAFKLDENYNELNYVSAENDENNNLKWVTIEELKEMLEDEDKAADLLAALKTIDGVVTNDIVDWDKLEDVMQENIATWKNEVIKNKLTTAYINNKVNALYEDAKIEIFDNTAKMYYNQSATTKATGKGKTGNVLLSFEGKLNDETVKFEITVDEYFAYLNNRVGLEAAIDLLVNKFLLKEYRKGNDGLFSDVKLNEADFRKEYKEFIQAFSNDQYAAAGYPASLGRETFLQLIFGTTNVDEIIEIGYIVPELRAEFSKNYDIQLGNTNVFEQLTYFTQLQYERAKGVNVSHLLVFFDLNGDDTPDNPADYFEKLDAAKVTEIKEAIVELYELILNEVGQTGLTSEKLSAIANEFQSYTRIGLGDYKPTKWEKYRKLGLNLKFETISSEITNKSNFPGGSTLDETFYNRALDLLDIILEDRQSDDEDLIAGGLPFLDFGGALNIVQAEQSITDLVDMLDEDGIMSAFGFHFILVTGVTDKVSAKYDPSDDTNKNYEVTIDDIKYNAYNEDDDMIIQSQIEYYVRGNQLEDGVVLPTKVNQAFNAYFQPILSLYNSDVMQVEVLNQLLVDNGLNLHGKDARFAVIREINRNQFHNNLLGKGIAEYDALYGEWFTKFGLTA